MTHMTDPPRTHDWLADAAAQTPAAIAVVENDGSVVSYRELDELATEAARTMAAETGLSRGDVTVIAVQQVGVPLLAMLWAAWRNGIAPLLIDHRSPLVSHQRS